MEKKHCSTRSNGEMKSGHNNSRIKVSLSSSQIESMPRRKASHSMRLVLGSTERLRNRMTSLPAPVRDGTKELHLAIFSQREAAAVHLT